MPRRLLALCVLLMAAGVARGEAARMVPIGSALREARLDPLNGPAHRLSDYRGRPLIINLWASWCGPCRSFAPHFEAAAGQRPQWRFVKVDSDANPQASADFAIRSIPTLLVFKSGKVVEQLVGAGHPRGDARQRSGPGQAGPEGLAEARERGVGGVAPASDHARTR